MGELLVKRILGALSACIVLAGLAAGAGVGPLRLGGPPSEAAAHGPAQEASKPAVQDASIPAKLTPKTEDAEVARVAARILSSFHYARRPVDEQTSTKLFDRYIDTLDPLRMFLFQSDMAEFEPYRRTLGDQIWKKGDTTPASRIFARLLERVQQQSEYATALLNSEQFTFTSDDTYQITRKDAPRPLDTEDAKRLWRDRLRYEYLQEKLSKGKPEDIKTTLTKRYSRTLKNLKDLDADDIFEIYLTCLAQVYDPHSSFMGKPSLDAFNISMRLSLSGIGAQLTSEDGYCKIAELVPGGPAMKSGQVKVGDRIVAVAQGEDKPVDTVDMKVNKIVELIRGTKGTVVKLTIWPADATDPAVRKIVTLTRDHVKLEEQEAKTQIIDIPDPKGGVTRIGVIDLPSFYEDVTGRGKGGKSTSADVTRFLQKFQAEKVAGVILDLRKNGGGSLQEAIKLTGLFIKDGPIVQVRDPDGKVTIDDDPDPAVIYSGPLIVLTSRFSASASEILAGALQDYGRAVIVGDSSSHGKGTVQTLVQLGPLLEQRGVKLTTNPGALKLTIQKFYRASGASTQLRGVTPDIVLPSLSANSEIGEKALPNPMQWDTIPAAKYAPMGSVTAYLAELKKRSETRTAKAPEFIALREDVARIEKLLKDRTVSLNEQVRVKEKQEAEARVAARKKAMLAHKNPNEIIRTLTLNQVDKPGLPAPAATGITTAQTKPKKPNDLDLDGNDVEDEPASVDIALYEAKNILLDLVHLAAPKKVSALSN